MAAGACQIAWVRTGDNIADAMTKILSKYTRDYFLDDGRIELIG